MDSVLEPRGSLDIATIRLVLNHVSLDEQQQILQQQQDELMMSSQVQTTTSSVVSPKSNVNDSDQDDDKSGDESGKDDNNDDESVDDSYEDASPNLQSSSPTLRASSPTASTSPSSLASPSAASQKSSWLDTLSVAITSDGTMMVVGGGGAGGVGTGLAMVLAKRAQDQWKTSITLDHQSGQVDRITSIAILTLSSPHLEQAIAIGYTSGHLRIFSPFGNLLLSQLFHKAPIQRIKVKMSPVTSSSQERYVMQEVSILYPGNVVASMSGSSLAGVLGVCYQQVQRGDTASAAQTKLDFRKWSLGSVSAANDFTFAGPFLGSPFRALPYGTSEHAMTRLVVAGQDPMLAYYYPSDDAGSTFTVAVALVSSVAAKLTNAVYSFAKNWWGSSSSSTGNSAQQQESRQQETKIENPSPLHIRWSLIDRKRELKSLLMDPSGRYAVATDNLGRVLLIDIVNSLIVRVWKGYRDCQCGWINHPSNEDDEQEEGEHEQENDKEDGEGDVMTLEDFIPAKMMKKPLNDGSKFRTYLAIYIGRRGYLEVWGMKHKSRVVFEKVGMGCRLLSTSIPGKRPPIQQGQTQLSTPKNYQSRCYLINQDGILNEIIVHK